MSGKVTMTLKDWRGEAVKSALRSKIAEALNDTGAEAVTAAQAIAPRDTGFMANTIEVIKPATARDLSMTWGNITADYTLWVEIGARGRPGRFFLRRGAERAYPMLERRLRGAL